MRQVAAELGIDETTLYRKMSGKSDFYRKEIQKLCDLLKIEDPAAVFFAKKLT
ncbi:MAG: XRE family transcriptional regulator [Acutalibacter sp.]|nr:XRE family transcriptional regulator [Acutalibacter sp.]